MRSLNSHDVYEEEHGRSFDEDDPPTNDIITSGLQGITDVADNPPEHFNKAWTNLQARQRLDPIVGPGSIPTPSTSPTPPDTGNQSPLTNPILPSHPPSPVPTLSPIPTPSTSIDENSDRSQSEGEISGECGSESSSDRSTGGSASDESEVESDYEQAFARVVEGMDEPTLTRETAADVSLDMDEEEYEDSDLESEPSDDEISDLY